MTDDSLIAVSVLELDLGPSPLGWATELAARGIDVATDDLGRLAVTHAIAKQLLAERRQAEEAAARHRARIEEQAVQANADFRSRLWGGLAASALPDGVPPAAAFFAADREASPRRPSPLEDALAGNGMVYRPVGSDGAQP